MAIDKGFDSSKLETVIESLKELHKMKPDGELLIGVDVGGLMFDIQSIIASKDESENRIFFVIDGKELVRKIAPYVFDAMNNHAKEKDRNDEETVH